MNIHTAITVLLVLVGTTSMNQFNNEVRVTYGSLVKLINPASNLILHSHDIFFGRGGVLSVTGYHIDDLGSFWQLNQKHKSFTKSYQDPLRCSDTITISSSTQGYYLRVEQTQFGLTTELLPMVHGIQSQNIDEKINFQLQCVDKTQHEEIHYNDKIRLKHQITGKYVSIDPAYAYTEGNCGRGCVIAGQLELHALDASDDATTVFQIKTGLAFDPNYVNGPQNTQQ